MNFLRNNFNQKLLKIPMPDGTSVFKTLKSHFNTTFVCSDDIKNFDDAKREGKKYFENALKEYAKFFKYSWAQNNILIYFDEEWKTYNESELYAQWSDNVQGKITKYQSILASRPGFNPDYCNYDFKELWEPFNKYRNNR